MPLLKRKKVISLPVPAALAALPDPTERQRFLESDPYVADQEAQLASGSHSHGPSSTREGSKPNGASASRHNGDPYHDDDDDDHFRTSRKEEFDGVVIDRPRGKGSYHASSPSRSDTKAWQPLKDSLRLLPSKPSPTMDIDDEEEDALIAPENADDKLLGTLLVLKQKQADLLALKRRARCPSDAANGKRPRSSGKADDLMAEVQHRAEDRANGEMVYEEMDDPGRYDAAKVPLQLGKWVEPEVYVIAKTGEIFATYEEYIERIGFYQQPQFTCEVTGKTGLTFFEALASEREEALAIHRVFPPPLKTPILKSVQFVVEGRLDDLVDRVWDRFAHRFYPNEKVFVTLPGGEDKYFCNVQSVRRKSAAGLLSRNEDSDDAYHPIGTNLWISPEEVEERDPPSDYEYTLQLFGQEQVDESDYFKASDDSPEHWGNVIITASADRIDRDRIQFSKVALKRLLRESLERDSEMYSPWRVKPAVARAYNVPLEMSDSLRHRIMSGREDALNERKAMIRRAHDEDPENKLPPKKKHKKNPELDEDEGSARAKADKAVNKGGRPKGSKNKINIDKQAEEERIKAEQEQRDREAAAEEEKKKRKKPNKFPAEDLLVEMNEKERLAGKPLQRPALSKRLPFPGNFEVFLETWNFLNAMSKPLKLAQFSIDEFENALYHRDPSTPCILIAETHAALLNLLRRDVVDDKQEETLPLKAFGLSAPGEGEDNSDAGAISVDGSDELQEEKLELITEAAGKYATSWMAKDLSARDNRKGWEGALVGCLWMRSNVKTVPNLVNYLQALLIEDNRQADSRPTWHTEETRLAKRLDYKYHALHPIFKLEILAFLCELVMQTKRVRDHIEEAALLLTKCRNDQNECKREIKKLIEERNVLEPGAEKTNGAASTPGPSADVEMEEKLAIESNLSDSDALSDIGSESDAEKPSGAAARKKALADKLLQREAEQKAKDEQNAKHAAATKAKRHESDERKRLDEELLILEEQKAELDREFRRRHQAPRTTPIGTDRFGNRIWWFDGCGTADIITEDGQIIAGTGRLYIQGTTEFDLATRCELFEVTEEEVNERRVLEEGQDAVLAEGEWAMIDESDQYRQFFQWLNPRGFRERDVYNYLHRFEYAVLGSILQREALFAPDQPEEDQNWAQRPKRGGKVAKPAPRGKLAYLGYKNTLAK